MYFSHHILQRIVLVQNDNSDITFVPKFEIAYKEEVDRLKTTVGGMMYTWNENHILLRDEKPIGGLLEIIQIAIHEFGIADAEVANFRVFDKEATTRTLNAAKATGHPTVFIDYIQEEVVIGRLTIELFDDICPRACENFLRLCTGEAGTRDGVALHYKDTPIHRIVPNGWFQAGDIVDGSGLNSVSSYDSLVEDESFGIEFDRSGVVGYSTSAPHSNGSQFFITLGPCEWMNCTKVGFGILLQGYDFLKKLHSIKCNNQRPCSPITVKSSGVFYRVKK